MASAAQFERFTSTRWAVLALVCVAVLLYLPSLANGFAMDDEPLAWSQGKAVPGPDPVITAEYDAGALDYLAKFFVRPYWWPESYNDGLYRPVTVLSYGLVYQVWGRFLAPEREALPQHAVNVLLHGWAVWLVFQLLGAVGASRVVAWLAGMLFAVHGIHSEVVAGIVGRAELFAFAFGAQAMCLLLRGGAARRVGAGVLMFCALSSKESAFCWIPFFYCLVWTRGQLRPDAPAAWAGRAGIATAAAFLLPALLWWWLRSLAMEFEAPIAAPADPLSNPLGYASTAVRLLTAVKVWGYGLWLCVVPYPLSCLYSPHVFSLVESPWDPGFLLAALCLSGSLAAGIALRRRLPLLFLAVAVFLGFSFVTSNVPLAIGTIFGERLYYTPSLGLCLVPALLWPRLRSRGRTILLAVLGCWCLANTAVAMTRTAAWRDSFTVFGTDVETYPMAVDLQRKTAACLAAPGPDQDLDRAQARLEEGLRLMPDSPHCHRELGQLFRTRKDFAGAIPHYERALASGYPEPEGAESIALLAIGDCHRALAEAATGPDARRRAAGRAAEWYRKVLAVPNWADSRGEALNNLGRVDVLLSTLETDPAARRARLRAAIGFFERTIALGQSARRSHIAAYCALLQHGTDPELLFSKERCAEIYAQIRGQNLQDPQLLILLGAMAYRAGLSSRHVMVPLEMGFRALPESERDASFYKAHLFYADACKETGRVADYRRILTMLLTRPELEDSLKQQIRARLAAGEKR